MASFELLPKEIDGADTEELLSELYEKYADRELVRFHRAIAAGNVELVNNYLQEHPEWIDAPLIALTCQEEVKKSNGLDFDLIGSFPGISLQTTAYPEVPQFVTGNDGEPNELYPTGDVGEPETNLDTAFWSPLLRACYSGNADVISCLCERGANKNFVSPCHANALTAVLRNPFDTDCIPSNLRTVATAENVKFLDYFFMALTNEDLSRVDIIQALLDVNCPVDRNSETFQGDWRSWIEPDIAECLAPFLESA